MKSQKYGYLQWCVVFVAFLFFGIRMFRYIVTYTVNILYLDEWSNVARLMYDSLPRLFREFHGVHPIGTGLALNLFLSRISHWDVLYETVCIGILLVIACIIAVLLKKRLVGSINFSDIVIPALFFTLSQQENLLWGNQIPYVLPLVFLFLVSYIRLFPRSRLRDILLLLLALLSVRASFQGVFVSIFVYITFCIDLVASETIWEKIRYGVFLYLVYRACLFVSVVSPGLTIGSAASLPFFASYVLREMNTLLGFSDIGSQAFVIPFLTMFVLFMTARLPKSDMSAMKKLSFLYLMGYSLLFFVSVFVGRESEGLTSASAPRYVTHAIPLYYCLYLGLCMFAKKLKNGYIVPLVVLFFLFNTFAQDTVNYREGEKERFLRNKWKSCYLANESIQFCNEKTHIQIYPYFPEYQKNELMQILKDNKLNLYNGH